MEENDSRFIDMNENLATDKIRVPSQNYALISIVLNNSTQKSKRSCVKKKVCSKHWKKQTITLQKS